MAKVYITEFAQAGRAEGDINVQTGLVSSPLTTQVINVTGTSTACTNSFNPRTVLVRVSSDIPVCILFGSTPTATINDMRIPAEGVEYFSILAGSGYKMAAILAG